MTRALYSALVWLHPPAFREQFGSEMLWIFDSSAADDSPFTRPRMFADASLSLARQWVIGQGTWKIAAGFLGGVLHLWLVFGLLMLRPPLIHREPAVTGELAIFHHEEKPRCWNCAALGSSIPESPR